MSIVIPVFNERENLHPLYDEISLAIEKQYKDVEIIFVNDGSFDGSLEELKKMHESDPRIKVISFRKNFGQSPAIGAGFDYCRGDVIVTLDADMQNNPADIPMMTAKILQGYDIVNGWRKDRKDKLLTRKIPSIFGNRLISLITKVKLHDYGCTLRAFRRDVVKNLKLYGEMHRYIPAIASRMGIRSLEVPVDHRERRFGKTKYGLDRTFRVILDLISLKYLLSYSHRPLQIFGSLGLASIFAGFISGIWLSYEKFFLQKGIQGRPLLFLTVLLISLGFQMITLGLLGEMLSRIYHEGLNKNVYSIRETLGFSDEDINDRSRTLF